MRIILLILMVFIVQLWISQNIRGTVFESQEEKKSPLTGVNIFWLGTQSGVTSDDAGKYSISMVNNSDKLVFSMVGFRNDTIDVGDLNSGNGTHEINIELFSGEFLEEVEIFERAAGAHFSRLNNIQTQKITSSELKKAACCNLSESFETNASVDVEYSDAISGAKQIKLLGLAGIYSQMLTENIPNLRGLAVPYGLDYIPGSWMESIYVSKGTSSVKNGYESITGQINIEYKKPDEPEKFFINGYANQLGKIEGNINASHKVNSKLSTMLFAHAENFSNKVDMNKDGFLDQPLKNQYTFFNRWKYKGENILGQAGIRFLHEERTGGQTAFEKGMENVISNPYGINIETDRIEAFTKSAYLFKNRPGTNIGFINSFIHHKQNSLFGLNNYHAVENNYYGNLMFQTYLWNTNHYITTGISYIYDHYEEQLNDSAFSKKESVPGGFLEYTHSNPDKFSLIIGLRSDFHNIYGTLITPRVHFKYHLTANTIFRASAGKGYRSPNIIAENTFILASSRELVILDEPEMEEAWNFGINVSQYFHIGKRELTLNADFYRTEFVNQVIIDRDADISKVYIYNLDGQSFSNSFQVEAIYEVFKGFEVLAAFRYNDVKMTIDESLKRKPLVNKYKGLVNLSYATNYKKWQFDFTTQLNGDSRLPDVSANPEAADLPDFSPEYVILNAQISRKFRNWEIYIGGENLTNYKQDNPVIASDDPFGPYFDSSIIWGPIMGAKIYTGFRYTIQ